MIKRIIKGDYSFVSEETAQFSQTDCSAVTESESWTCDDREYKCRRYYGLMLRHGKIDREESSRYEAKQRERDRQFAILPLLSLRPD